MCSRKISQRHLFNQMIVIAQSVSAFIKIRYLLWVAIQLNIFIDFLTVLLYDVVPHQIDVFGFH